MKGLILSGGFGTRLRPLTYSQQKQLIPVANKPILFYGIEDLIEAGIHDIGIIVGPNKEQVKETVGNTSWDADISFIEQDYPRGIAHTIKIARDFIGDNPFIMYLGDNILKEGVVEHVNDFLHSDCQGSILLTRVPNPQEFGVARLDAHNNIIEIIEKPKNPPTDYAVIGVYLFRQKIFQAVDEITYSHRNQLEITDAIQWLINHGFKVKSALVRDWWKDTGKPEDILHANRLVLDMIESKNLGKSDGADIRGRVQINEETFIDEKCTIKGPVIIGKNCKLSESYIGPYTSIGDNCEIVGTEIEDSVIMDNVSISHGERIVDSLIGRGVKIFKKNDLPNGKRFIIGDNSEVCI